MRSSWLRQPPPLFRGARVAEEPPKPFSCPHRAKICAAFSAANCAAKPAASQSPDARRSRGRNATGDRDAHRCPRSTPGRQCCANSIPDCGSPPWQHPRSERSNRPLTRPKLCETLSSWLLSDRRRLPRSTCRWQTWLPAQCAQKLFARKCVVVGPGNRAVHRPAVPPQRRTDRADASAPRAFLLPQLLARSGNLPAGLGRVRAAMLPGAVVLYRFPEQVFVHGAENLVSQVQASDLLATQIVNIDSCHIASRLCPCGAGTFARYFLADRSVRPTLCFLSCSLGRLQRVDRRRSGKSATLSWRLLCLQNNDVAALRSGHAAFHHQQILVLIHAQHSQVAHGHALMPHMSRHAHAFEHARWKRRGADRPGNLKHRTMRFGSTAEMMPLHDTLKTSTLAGSDDIDKLFAFENLNQHAIADLHGSVAIAIAFECDLAHEFHRRQIVLAQMSLGGLGQLRLLHQFDQADLRRLVTVFGRRLMLCNHARAGLQHRHGAHIALRVEQLRHADFFAQNSGDSRCHFLLRPAWVASWRLLAGRS